MDNDEKQKKLLLYMNFILSVIAGLLLVIIINKL